MNKKLIIAGCLALCVFIPLAQAEVVRREANNGNLVMEDIPEIPQAVVAELNRYQNVRSAGFQGWTEDGEGIYVTTRFGDVSQIHHVGIPGGARTQLTFLMSRQGAWCVSPAATS